MHNIGMDHFVGASGEKMPVGYVHDDRIRTANLKRRYAVNESIDDSHLQAKMFKSSLVPVLATMKDYHQQQHHHQQPSNQHNLLETHQVQQLHNQSQNEEVIVDYATLEHNKYSNLVQQTCCDNVDGSVEYVNIMFDNNLLPVQNQIISEPNYYTDEELNGSNWNNVDLLDLDQRNLFFETATTTMKTTVSAVSSSTSALVAATQTNHQQTSGRDEFHMKTTAKNVPSMIIICILKQTIFNFGIKINFMVSQICFGYENNGRYVRLGCGILYPVCRRPKRR